MTTFLTITLLALLVLTVAPGVCLALALRMYFSGPRQVTAEALEDDELPRQALLDEFTLALRSLAAKA